MINTPTSLRLQIAITGRTNTGKSSFLNLIAGQDVSITSSYKGTTTDIVEKSFELLPIGPVTFLDTAGIDDDSGLSGKRVERAFKIFDRADIVVIVSEYSNWSLFEMELISKAKEKGLPVIIVLNKSDIDEAPKEFLQQLRNESKHVMVCNSIDIDSSEKYRNEFKNLIQEALPESNFRSVPLLSDLIVKDSLVVLIVPIDGSAPKGRIILPQVQAIRDVLDSNALTMVVKETEYLPALRMLNRKPDLVICDSQVVDKMVAETPEDVKCTTFSILFSRFKGDLNEEVRGAAVIDHLKEGDKVLVAEACSHHPMEEDIGRVKIPKWLKNYIGADIEIDHAAGRDYPSDVEKYSLIIHCGACMLTRHEKINRIESAKKINVPITNYGILISKIHGVLDRVLSPFPEALDIYRDGAGGRFRYPY